MRFHPSTPPEFQPGDIVTVRTWDDMLFQYGPGDSGSIRTPYLPFLNGMKPFCGHSYKIMTVKPSIDNSRWIYDLESCGYHLFTVDMFVQPVSAPPSSISFDQLLQGR